MSGSGYFDTNFGNWLPDDDTLPSGGCSKCGCDLYEGDEVFELEGEIYCSKDCILDVLDITETTMERGM